MPKKSSQGPGEYLKVFANTPAGLPLRLSYDLWHANNENMKVRLWSESIGIKPLEISDWRASLAQTQTLYLLGSGESVELMPGSVWEQIGEGYSIGINAWPLHEFIPNLYAFEPFDPASLDYVKLFSHVLHDVRIAKAKPQLLLFRPHSYLDAERYLMIPKKLRENSRLYGRVVPSTNRKSELAREIRAIHQLARAGFIGDSLVVDLGASVIRLISLGMQLGFRTIVLVGVDLNGGAYFWEKNNSYIERRGLRSFSPGFDRPVHETMIAEKKSFIATEVIGALQSILTRLGGSIQVAHPSSALANFLPVRDWGKLERAETSRSNKT